MATIRRNFPENSKIKYWYQIISNNKQLNYIWQFSNENIEDTLGWDFEWFIKNWKDFWYDRYLEAKKSWIFDFFKDSMDTFNEVWWDTAIIQYKKWKEWEHVWHILDSKNWKWDNNIIVELWNATKRIITLSYEWTKQSFEWMLWWEAPIEKLKKWLEKSKKETT